MDTPLVPKVGANRCNGDGNAFISDSLDGKIVKKPFKKQCFGIHAYAGDTSQRRDDISTPICHNIVKYEGVLSLSARQVPGIMHSSENTSPNTMDTSPGVARRRPCLLRTPRKNIQPLRTDLRNRRLVGNGRLGMPRDVFSDTELKDASEALDENLLADSAVMAISRRVREDNKHEYQVDASLPTIATSRPRFPLNTPCTEVCTIIHGYEMFFDVSDKSDGHR